MSSFVARPFTLQLAAAMLGTLLLNYIGWALGHPALLSNVTLVVYLILVAICLGTPRGWVSHALWPRLFLLTLLVIGLGTVTDAWDARSIWMFHGKRIYLDANLYAQLDGYFGLSHNKYPVLVPALAASIARMIGGWNEIAPKLAGMLIWVPALLVIVELLPNTAARLLFLIAVLMIDGAGLINGLLDMPLALTATACAASMQRLLDAPASGFDARPGHATALLVPLLLAVMSVTKDEGSALAALLAMVFATIVAAQRRLREFRMTLLLVVISFAPMIAWTWACQARGVLVGLGPGFLERVLGRLLATDSHSLIIDELLASTPLLLCVLVATWGVAGSLGRARQVVMPLGVAILYLALLYGVYLGTSYDLQWHLASSASRVLCSVQLLLLYAGLASWFTNRAEQGSGAIAR